MVNARARVLGWILTLVLFTGSGADAAPYEYIDISNPFLKKIPIAVPHLQAVSGNPQEGEAVVRISDMLSQGLEFTGYFKMLDRAAFIVDPKSDWSSGRINFRNWTSIGAELLVAGSVVVQGPLIEVELRLYDTFKERMVIGKRYKGYLEDQRRIVHRFCSEVIHILTGDRGLFESKIIFESKAGGAKEIVTCDFDGHDPVAFTGNKSINLTPAWSSDGQWVAFTSYMRGRPDLYIQHVKDKHGYVVDKKGINTTPAWVPGQFALAATLSFEGDQEIYLLTGKGKIIKRITHSDGIDVSPTWSPDGKQLAFVSDRSGSPQIYIKDIASGREERLTYDGKYNTSPSWSPKGDRIAYSAMNNGSFDICAIRADGSGLFRLTGNQGNNESPSWSPDGSLIAYSSTREGPSRIYVMTAFGTDQRCLLTLPGEQMNPEWSKGVMNP